jgi:SRSO17 transposase
MENTTYQQIFSKLNHQFTLTIVWLSSLFSRKDTANVCAAYVRALLSTVDRKNTWQLAEVAGKKDPYGFQYLLGRAKWDQNMVRDELIKHVITSLGHEDSVMSVDETGFLKKGDKSSGVARQYTGTAGRIENCQIGVFLNYSTPKGHTLIDRELYLPQEWTGNNEKLKSVGLDPEKVRFKTKIELARLMVERAYSLGAKPNWIAADSVYGGDYKFRVWLEEHRQAYVLGVKTNQYICIGMRQKTAKDLFKEVPPHAWYELSSGIGTKGRRMHKWAAVKINHPYDGTVSRWALCRQSVKDSTECTYYLAFAKTDTSLEKLAEAAGRRWTIEECFETAKGETGLDQYEVRSAMGWYRHITLSMVAQAILAISRSKVFPKVDAKSKMNAFKKKRKILCA